jgi:Icc-related predicted phosphoesterase
MSSQHVNRILCVSQLRGSPEAVKQLVRVADERRADAVALIGDLSERSLGFRAVFAALADVRRPVYWIPGPGDAPAESYLRESYNIKIAFPQLSGVHGTASIVVGVAFAGMGGEIHDETDVARDEEGHLRYLRWEAAYRPRSSARSTTTSS